ncbi:MAG TPA: alpha/beta fold hydrolase, partial [Terriglobales bacterium]|nr:alpha/beta fold hydrolase [Terriglobales bacterium]
TAPVNGIDIYYEEHGSGEPLLLIMGLAADINGWLFQVPEFSKHHRTIVFDNRGVGRSSKPAGPYTIQMMADDAAGLLDHLGIERAHVAGISMGGMISQELALRHPHKVAKLVLGCTYAFPDDSVAALRNTLVGQLGGAVGGDGSLQIDPSKIDPMQLFGALLPLSFSPSFLQNELPKLMQVFAGALQYGFSMEGVLAQVMATSSHNTLERLAQIQAPTLVLTGDCDQLIPAACSDVLAEKIPGAKLRKLEGGSHGFNFEVPEQFNRAVLDFLAG